MNRIEILKNQVAFVKKQTDQLVERIGASKWNDIPGILETNLNWQIGHIVLANYLHGIASLSGANDKIRSRVNINNYIKFYGPKSQPSDLLEEKPKSGELREVYEFVFELIWSELERLEETDLDEQTEIPNPGAKTKYEALRLLFTHQSWHNGQIAILNRVLSEEKVMG